MSTPTAKKEEEEPSSSSSSVEEDANDGVVPYTQHGKPTEGMCCMCTMEDITMENQNYVEYQSYPSMKWKPALFEKCVVEELLNTQFDRYIERVKKTDCQAELRRLLKTGPPTYISDKHAFPLTAANGDENDDTHVINLWYAEDGEERSAKLKGAVDGVEREELMESLKEFIIVEGKEDGDDDDDDDDDESDDDEENGGGKKKESDIGI